MATSNIYPLQLLNYYTGYASTQTEVRNASAAQHYKLWLITINDCREI
jgi:hypothetical protein